MEIYEKIKDHVTAFSGELPVRFQHTDEVIVGGKVVSFFNGRNFMPPLPEFQDEGYYITIEDGIGTICILVMKPLYDAIIAEHGRDFDFVGQFILVTGGYDVLDKRGSYIAKDGSEMGLTNPNPEMPRVAAWQIDII